MKILTSLNSIHDAEEILHWLASHGVEASIAGRASHAAAVFIPNGLSIQIHHDYQFGYARKLLKELDGGKESTVRKKDFLVRLREKNLDQIFIGGVTLLLVVVLVWIVQVVVLAR